MSSVVSFRSRKFSIFQVRRSFKRAFREIHTSDLQRTWSVQANYHKEDPTRINWGKFATIGGIIEEISACQKRCRRSVNKTFNFPERAQIRRWIEDTELMDSEVK